MVLLVDAFWNAPSAFWNVLSLFRRQRELGKGFDAPVGPDAMQELEVVLSGSMHKKTPTKIYWNLAGQHTISWKEPITILIEGVSTTLRPASLNIYLFPRVTWATPRVVGKKGKASLFMVANAALEATKKSSEVLTGSELHVLQQIFYAIARDPREREVRFAARTRRWARPAGSTRGSRASSSPCRCRAP